MRVCMYLVFSVAHAILTNAENGHYQCLCQLTAYYVTHNKYAVKNVPLYAIICLIV